MASDTCGVRSAPAAIIFAVAALVAPARALTATSTFTLTATATPTPNSFTCGDTCDGRTCIAPPLFREGTCMPSADGCRCVPVTPAPGECDVACDSRPCTTRCSDGTTPNGFCTLLTVDTGCACDACCFGDCNRNGAVTIDELMTI